MQPRNAPPLSIKQSWPGRHPVWSAVIAIAVLLIIVISATSKSPTKTSNTAADSSPRPTATPTVRSSALECHAQATIRRPRDHTTVTVNVHTAAHVEVTATSHGETPGSKKITGSSNANGNWALRVRVGNTPPGTQVVVTVRVSRRGGTGSCQASFAPRATAVSAAAATQSAAPPATPPPSPAPAATQPLASPPAAACYPVSDEGTCYEPGEYCRDSDHGASGVAGDGESIVCEDNDGWRWEPA